MRKDVKRRDSGIELLRVISSVGVMTLHYTNAVASQITTSGGGSLIFFYFLRAIFLPAVNIFVLISSFYLSDRNDRDWMKPALFYSRVILYALGFYLATSLFHHSFSLGKAIWSLIPGNWFLPLYIAIYLISPYINIAFNNLSKKQREQMVLLFFILFSIIPTVVDFLKAITGSQFGGWEVISSGGSGSGYTIVQFVLLYVIGSYLRAHTLQPKRILIIVCLFLNTILIMTWMILGGRYFKSEASVIYSYCNPLIITEAVLLFLLFRSCCFKNRVVNYLGKSSVSMFLSHGWSTFLTSEMIRDFGLCIPWLLSVLMEYTLSIILELLWGCLIKPVFWMRKKIISVCLNAKK